MCELLAPAGNKESLIAAIQAGCNAVYLSGKAFGARAFAANFSLDELKEAISYAHLHHVKVYLTLNTLIMEKELVSIEEYLQELTVIKPDALLIQDLGLIKLIKTKYPYFTVHASTQMNIYSEKAVKYLKQLGVERIVLARETDLETVKKIKEEGLEVEVFVHGALCFSSSGNCYLSSRIGGRSGNRGRCAGPCRKNYQLLEDGKILNTNKAYLSMKDLNTIENIKELVDLHIDSFKIEGRMKSPEYVYTITSLYKKAINEALNGHNYKVSKQEMKNIELSFNRLFTTGYLFNDDNNSLVNPLFVNHHGIEIGRVIKCNQNYVEIKLFDDLNLHDGIRLIDPNYQNEIGLLVTSMYKGDKLIKSAHKNDLIRINVKNKVQNGYLVLKTLSSDLTSEVNNIIKKENIKFDLDVSLYLFVNKPSKLAFRIDNYADYVEGEVLNYSDQVLDDERIKEQISKLNSTVYKIRKFNLHKDDVFIAIKELNNLRNQMVNKINDYYLNLTNPSPTNYQLKNNEQYPKKKELYLDIVVSNDEQALAFSDKKIFIKEKTYNGRINDGNGLIIHNISQIKNKAIPSMYFNVLNHYSIEVLHDLGFKDVYLGLECSKNNLIDLNLVNNNLNIGFFCYGRCDLMVSKHCVIAEEKGFKNKNCGSCLNHSYELVDEYHNHLPLILEKNNDCTMRIVDYEVLNLVNDLDDLIKLGINRFMLVFTNETKEECQKIYQDYLKALNNKMTIHKNYFKGFYENEIE